MYVLIVKGPRRATLAVHTLDSYAELRDLIAIYHALDYTDDSLIVEKRQKQAA